MINQQIVKEERSVSDLFSELVSETSTLVRQEVALAQTELAEKAVDIGKNVGALLIGGAVGYAALLAMLAAVVIGLSSFIPAWLAALLVAAAVGVVSYFLITSALTALKKTEFAPRETVQTLKEDAQWLKKQMS